MNFQAYQALEPIGSTVGAARSMNVCNGLALMTDQRQIYLFHDLYQHQLASFSFCMPLLGIDYIEKLTPIKQH